MSLEVPDTTQIRNYPRSDQKPLWLIPFLFVLQHPVAHLFSLTIKRSLWFPAFINQDGGTSNLKEYFLSPPDIFHVTFKNFIWPQEEEWEY